MENRQYESVQALVRQLHAPSKNVSRPHSDEETSSSDAKVERKHSVYSLPILAVEKLSHRKRSLFESTFKIPTLTVTGAESTPESPENMAHRRFSFGNFRRLSHSATVRHSELLCVYYVLMDDWLRINPK